MAAITVMAAMEACIVFMGISVFSRLPGFCRGPAMIKTMPLSRRGSGRSEKTGALRWTSPCGAAGEPADSAALFPGILLEQNIAVPQGLPRFHFISILGYSTLQ
jgi:hypothetical protein